MSSINPEHPDFNIPTGPIEGSKTEGTQSTEQSQLDQVGAENRGQIMGSKEKVPVEGEVGLSGLTGLKTDNPAVDKKLEEVATKVVISHLKNAIEENRP
jgi:hypothetical protein